jgi:phage/plasmid-associated DNA primase
LTARKIRQDNITWETTHSLFLTTNYVPQVAETDHGTWRRLALVRFRYTYTAGAITHPMARKAVPGLRERLRDGRHGQHEAILAWIVESAMKWYANDRVMPTMPPQVRKDTDGWRGEADLIFSYLTDQLEFDHDSHIVTGELFADFRAWLKDRGHHDWAQETFDGRFGGHELVDGKVLKKRTRDGKPSRREFAHGVLPAQYRGWFGIKFRAAPDTVKKLTVPAVSGPSVNHEIDSS